MHCKPVIVFLRSMADATNGWSRYGNGQAIVISGYLVVCFVHGFHECLGFSMVLG